MNRVERVSSVSADGPEGPTPQDVQLDSLAIDAAVGTPTVRARAYLSTYHLRAADRLAKDSGSAENAFRGDPAPIGGKPPQEIQDALFEHRGYVTGAILAGVAFLEALINELFLDVVDYEAAEPKPAPPDPPTPVHQLPPPGRERMAKMWLYGIEKLRMLRKFEAALTLAEKQVFDRGAAPYQDVPLLIALRNKLVHFQPEWSGGEADRNFEQRLEGKLSLHPWFEGSPGNPFFPDKCLGHGCAEWAVSTSLRFADEFCSRMGITPNYHAFKPSRAT